MKKFLTVALVALLAVSTVFAVTLEGSAEIVGKLDLTKDKVGAGFASNGTSAKATFTFEGATGSAKSEGEIYAEIAGAFSVATQEVEADGVVPFTVEDLGITKAVIGGDNWSVSILGPKGVDTFAQDWYKSADKKFRNAALSVAAKGAGVTATVYDYAIGFGGWVGQDKKEGTLTVATPDFLADEALTLKAAAGASYAESKLNSGVGLTFTYDGDVKATVSADFADVYNVSSKANDFTVDAAANVSYKGVTGKAYFATKTDNGLENYYTVGADVALKDLTGLDLTVGLGALNIKKEAGDVYADVTYKFENGSASAKSTVSTAATIDWTLALDADYKFENVGKLAAGMDFAGNKAEALSSLKADVSFSNDTLIKGATLAAKYATGNLLKDVADRFGALTASCTLEF